MGFFLPYNIFLANVIYCMLLFKRMQNLNVSFFYKASSANQNFIPFFLSTHFLFARLVQMRTYVLSNQFYEKMVMCLFNRNS